MKIGLTGSIACGKSTVSSYLLSLGYPVVDADAISRSLTAQGGAALPAIRAAFGDDVFVDSYTLDRRALGSVVFGSKEKLEQLNAILHPMIIETIECELRNLSAQHPIVFGDVPLLFECGMDAHFDQIWVVTAPREVQIARLYERDGLSREDACARIDAQMPQEEKCRRAHAVISTNGPISQTRIQVDRLLSIISDRRQI